MFRKYLAPFRLLLCLGMVAPAATPGPFALRHSLFDPKTNAQPEAWFGGTVRVGGDLVVVGESRDNLGAPDSGSV